MVRHRRETVSNSAADRAGRVLRELRAPSDGRPGVTGEDEATAYEVAEAYRALHALPLSRVTVGVRSMARTVMRSDEFRPGQRFKRMDRIVWKLVRHPHMRLSQMEDIGGCRVVLPTVDAVYSLSERAMSAWRGTARITDYIASPKADGYRGIHIVERRDGRLIEVQVRTRGQHEWAQTIEAIEPITGYRLKDGGGPPPLREYLRVAAERIAVMEGGGNLDVEAEELFADLRQQVRRYFEGGGQWHSSTS